MNRRSFLASAGAVTIASRLPAQAGKTGEDARLQTALDKIFYDRLADNPERATGLGLDTGARAPLKRRLGDYSSSQRPRQLARARAERATLGRIDKAKLGPASAIDYEVVDYQLASAISGAGRFNYGSAGGRFSPYVLSQLTGAYRDIPDFLESEHQVKSADDADAYLSRLEAFPTALDHNLAHAREDAAKGVLAPDYILDTTTKLLRALRDQPAADTVIVASFSKKLAAAGLPADRAARAQAIVEQKIFPALDRQIAGVEAFKPKSVHDAGVWRLPDGDAYYAAAAEAATTVKLSGDEIHQLGLDQVAEIGARLDKVLAAQGMTKGSVGDRLVALNKDPDQLYANTDPGREALIAQLNLQIAATYRRLPEAFATLPKAKVEARRVPVFIQAGAPGGYYNSAPLDGSRPAVYYINLRDTFDRPKFGLRTLTYHEAVPGHHLQISISQESSDIPIIRRLGGGFSGYTEGWALYSEQLADELGMYKDYPIGVAGYLQSFLFRATRLVVDSGMHAKRWSREKATDYLIATTGIARGRSQNEIDRYTVWPGQACSYKIGHTMWEKLRAEAKAAQGDRFDLKQFHEVLRQGAMPLTVLERVVRARTA